jgi:hypothetical protein
MIDQEKLRKLTEQLEQERDELKLKIGLARLEARDEWKDLEGKMESLRGRARVVRDEAREASGDVGAAADVLADEIKEGFARLRKLV